MYFSHKIAQKMYRLPKSFAKSQYLSVAKYAKLKIAKLTCLENFMYKVK